MIVGVLILNSIFLGALFRVMIGKHPAIAIAAVVCGAICGLFFGSHIATKAILATLLMPLAFGGYKLADLFKQRKSS